MFASFSCHPLEPARPHLGVRFMVSSLSASLVTVSHAPLILESATSKHAFFFNDATGHASSASRCWTNFRGRRLGSSCLEEECWRERRERLARCHRALIVLIGLRQALGGDSSRQLLEIQQPTFATLRLMGMDGHTLGALAAGRGAFHYGIQP